MFSILFYISLPVFFCIHELEEQLERRRWEKNHYDDIVTKFPKFRRLVSIMRAITPLEYAIVELEQFMFISMAVVLGIYADPIPMCTLFWGFCIHLVLHHVLICVVTRSFFPGLITSVLLMPYFFFGAKDLLTQYTLADNILMAVVGSFVAMFNLILMYLLMKKFSDLD